MRSSVRFILVSTSHPGNIGAAARALKTMSFDSLYLVTPEEFPHDYATARAAGATDVLDNAVVVNTLKEAIADCELVIGTSARSRTLSWPLMTPRECAEKVAQESQSSQVAIVFGAEQSGLTNEQLHLCHFHVHIPTNPVYSSLNLAAAVQVLSYEISVALQLNEDNSLASHAKYPPADAVNHYYQRLEQLLYDVDFFDRRKSKTLMSRIKRLFNRARLEREELNVLQGILTAINKTLKLTEERL